MKKDPTEDKSWEGKVSHPIEKKKHLPPSKFFFSIVLKPMTFESFQTYRSTYDPAYEKQEAQIQSWCFKK